jgi:uncharacterized repeat protein (TIGR01451 family)
MKRSALQCVVGFVGATLIVVGVVWTCQQLSSPTQLKASQGTSASAPSRSSAQRPNGSLSLSVTPEPTSTPSQDSSYNDGQTPDDNIRSTSASGNLSLSIVESSETDGRLELSESNYPTESFEFTPLDPLNETESSNISLGMGAFDSKMVASPLADSVTDNSFETPVSSELSVVDDLDSFENDFGNRQPASLSINVSDEITSSGPQDLLVDRNMSDFPNASSSTLLEDFPDELIEGELAAPDELPQATNTTSAPSLSFPIPTTKRPSTGAPDVSSLELSAQASEAGANFRTTSIAPPAERSGVLSNELIQYVTQDAASSPRPDSKYQGAQTTQIVVEKETPEEAQLNTTVKVTLTVKNLGTAEVSNLVLRDSIPDGAQYVPNSSAVAPNEQGEMLWPAFNLQPQSEKKFEYSIMPVREGEFGSVATVMVATSASSQTKCSKPELQVEVSAPQSVEVGQVVQFTIVASNIGSGVANNVSLQEFIPEGLYHPSGSVLDNKGLGSIKPGETKRISLELQAVKPGPVVNKLTVTAEHCDPQTVETNLSILSPMIELAITGPQTIYLERSATYQLSVKNVGDASAFDVKLTAQLPEGVKFVKANNLGAYKKEEHCVYWDLAELPTQTNADIELEIETTQAAQAELVFSASGPNELNAKTSHSINIDGLAALSFSVSSSTDLVEVGKEFQYSIQIENRGTKSSNNVMLQILTPDAISILATDGPTKATEQKGVIVFEKIGSVPAKSSVTYVIKATPSAPGDCRVAFQLSSDDLEPLVKEENTRVYQ